MANDSREQETYGPLNEMKHLLGDSRHQQILDDPARVYICSMTRLPVCSLSGQLLDFRKGSMHLNRAAKSVTILNTFDSLGNTGPSGIIYPTRHLTSDVLTSIPEGLFVRGTIAGTVDYDSFASYLTDSLIPWVQEKNNELPVILGMDLEETPIDAQVSNICRENGIILVLLPLDSTNNRRSPSNLLLTLLRRKKFQSIDRKTKTIEKTTIAVFVMRSIVMLTRESLIDSFKDFANSSTVHINSPITSKELNQVLYKRDPEVKSEEQEGSESLKLSFPKLPNGFRKYEVEGHKKIKSEYNGSSSSNLQPYSDSNFSLCQVRCIQRSYLYFISSHLCFTL